MVIQLCQNHEPRGNLLSHFSTMCSLKSPIARAKPSFLHFTMICFFSRGMMSTKKGAIFGQMLGMQAKNRQSQAIHFCYVYFFSLIRNGKQQLTLDWSQIVSPTGLISIIHRILGIVSRPGPPQILANCDRSFVRQ